MKAQARILSETLLTDHRTEEVVCSLDHTGFMRLYDEFFARVYNYVRYRCNDAHTADDLTAQAFENALSHLADFDPKKGTFGPWLFAIARNVVSNHLRAERRGACLPLDRVEAQADASTTPEDSLIESENQLELLDALKFLEERERDLLSLKFAAGLSNRRIAEVIGISETHVGVLLYRTLQRLRMILERQGARNG